MLKILLLNLMLIIVSCAVITDLSPRFDNTVFYQSKQRQSVSGRALCVAVSNDGNHVFIGGNSGIWRSRDGGETWKHLHSCQPPEGTTDVDGALWVPNVYDILVSPADKRQVLAATGNDARVPAKSGIYRSVNSGNDWELVHQFVRTYGSYTYIGNAACLAVAADDPNLVYAAGGYAIAVSSDGGVSWSETYPTSDFFERVFYVVAGPVQGNERNVFAVGSKVWFSQDGGATWAEDPVNISLAFPGDGPGSSSRALAINPLNPNLIYIMTRDRELWRGDFSAFETNGQADWRELANPPRNLNDMNTTRSGGDYVIAHADPEGNLYLIVSDGEYVHLTTGEPRFTSNWGRFDGGGNFHVDPHGLTLTPDFRLPPSPDDPGSPSSYGRIFMINDGGVAFSDDGAVSWHQGENLSTLGIVNVAVLSDPAKKPAFCIGMGDNGGFYSTDGAENWVTQDYDGGDNDCAFADYRQHNRLIVFAPREGIGEIFLYMDPADNYPDAGWNTNQRKSIPGPPPLPGTNKAAWNAASNFFTLGYRPLILTTKNEQPRPDGDFITIRFLQTSNQLLRTTKMSLITSQNDWVTSEISENSGAKVFRQGPNLPDISVNVVQASGGHDNPVYYVGDPDDQRRVWKWTAGMPDWEQIVPGPLSEPAIAERFFVDPYRPDIIYVLDSNHIRRSVDGGETWDPATNLEDELTENGSFPFQIVVPYYAEPGAKLLKDMQFDPLRLGYRFAVGPAGVFYTLNGVTWKHLMRTSAIPMRPNNAFYIPSPSEKRALYVATNNRGLLRIKPLPPD